MRALNTGFNEAATKRSRKVALESAVGIPAATRFNEAATKRSRKACTHQ